MLRAGPAGFFCVTSAPRAEASALAPPTVAMVTVARVTAAGPGAHRGLQAPRSPPAPALPPPVSPTQPSAATPSRASTGAFGSPGTSTTHFSQQIISALHLEQPCGALRAGSRQPLRCGWVTNSAKHTGSWKCTGFHLL